MNLSLDFEFIFSGLFWWGLPFGLFAIGSECYFDDIYESFEQQISPHI